MCKIMDEVRNNGGGDYSVKEIMTATSKTQDLFNQQLLARFDNFEDKNFKAHEKLGDKIDDTSKRKVSNTTFQLVIGMIMAIIGGVGTFIITAI